IRAKWIAESAPQGPVYVNFDAGMQEAELEPTAPSAAPLAAPAPARSAPAQDLVDQAARALSKADKPVILVGRVSRSESGWAERIRLAERIGAQVITDLKVGCGFPTDHPLHAGVPGIYLVAD